MNAGEQQHLSRRRGQLERWAQLQGDNSLDGAERFGVFVQHVVETVYLEAIPEHTETEKRRYHLEMCALDSTIHSASVSNQMIPATESAWSQPSEQNLRRAFLDDLVDLFVSERFHLFKRLVMTSSSVLSETITDSKEDREGFQPVLQPGGGRFRHFAMNAAAAEYYPPRLVDWAARAVGYDVPWRDDPSGDTAADLAANRVGRAFSRYLKDHCVAELAADAGVRVWVTKQFRG